MLIYSTMPFTKDMLNHPNSLIYVLNANVSQKYLGIFAMIKYRVNERTLMFF